MRRKVRALFLGFLGGLGVIVVGCSDGGRSEETEDPLTMLVRPATVSPGDLATVIIEGSSSASFARSSVSEFQRRRARGSGWRTIYVLNAISVRSIPPVIRFRPKQGVLGVELPADATERIKVPPVPEGDYRIAKTVRVGNDDGSSDRALLAQLAVK